MRNEKIQNSIVVLFESTLEIREFLVVRQKESSFETAEEDNARMRRLKEIFKLFLTSMAELNSYERIGDQLLDTYRLSQNT